MGEFRDPFPRLLSLGVFALTAIAGVLVLGIDEGTASSAFEDDLYYYLKIAKNVVEGRGLNFDGTTTTNGFHPLWLMLLIALSALVGANLGALHGGIWLLGALFLAWGASACYRMLRSFGHSARPAAVGSALYYGLSFYVAGGRGMEVIVTLALLPEFTRSVLKFQKDSSTKNLLLASIWGTLTVLSRVDSVIFLGLVGLVIARDLLREMRKSPGNAALGLSPMLVLVAYFGWNLLQFDALLPISALAKTARPLELPPLELFLKQVRRSRALAASLLCFIPALFLLRGHQHRRLITAGALFPMIQMGALLISTDWMILIWYYYSTAFGLLLLGAPLAEVARRRLAPGVLKLVAVVLVGLSFASPFAWVDKRVTWKELAQPRLMMKLTEFAESHPGNYAIGDCAGRFGFATDVSVLQLEGLVQDKVFLNHLERESSLLSLLSHYDIDYYATCRPKRVDQCIRVIEPNSARPVSAHVTETFCDKPDLWKWLPHHEGAKIGMFLAVYRVR